MKVVDQFHNSKGQLRSATFKSEEDAERSPDGAGGVRIPKVRKEYRQVAAMFNEARRWRRDPKRGRHWTTEELAAAVWRIVPPEDRETLTPTIFNRFVGGRLRVEAQTTPEDVLGIVAAAQALPLTEFHVLRSTFGLDFTDSITRLGQTTVWHRKALESEMQSRPGEKAFSAGLLDDRPIAEARVQARTVDAALILGDHLLKEFEAIMQIVACGSGGHTDFSIFHVQGSAYLPYLVHGQHGTRSGSSLVGPRVEVGYSQEELLEDQDTVPAAALWDIHGKAQRTEVEKKIMTCAYWFSLARRELDPTMSTTFAWFAIEALLPYESGKSAVSQLSKWASHLVDVNATYAGARKQQIGRLYNIRNDIAHGRIATLTEDVRKEVLNLVEALLNNACDESVRNAADESAYATAILARSLIREEPPAVNAEGGADAAPIVKPDVSRLRRKLSR